MFHSESFNRTEPLTAHCVPKFYLAFIMWIVLATGPLACDATNFLDLPISSSHEAPEHQAIQIAYPDLLFSDDGRSISANGNLWLGLGTARDGPPRTLLTNPSILEQFSYVYPLGFDLTQRQISYFDPGRLRNGDFFTMLYVSTESAAVANLIHVRQPSLTPSGFQVTRLRNVDCQLHAALSVLAASETDYSFAFREAGGGFNWRNVSGTSRLSAHSYGIAVDINAKIGQYWQWTGAPEGKIPDYHNRVPAELVSVMERFGFIWGGKWHHFDGMHFEYRPEIILHSRIVNGSDRF